MRVIRPVSVLSILHTRAGLVALVAACAVALSGCWETDAYDQLYVRNESAFVVGVEYEWSSGERIPLRGSPRDEQTSDHLSVSSSHAGAYENRKGIGG